MRSYITKTFAGLFVVTSIAAMSWCWPFPLGENVNGPINGGRIASGPNGHLVANWINSNFDLPFPNPIVTRIFTPGAGWSPQETLSGEDSFPQDPGHFAVSADGTVIAVWDEIPANENLGHFLMSRKFVPGRGWGPSQNLRPIWAFPTPAMSADSRAHVVYRDGSQIVARTLSPGEETWSDPVVLVTDSGQNSGEAQVVAGDGFAYATFVSVTEDDQLNLHYAQYLAHYGADGWAPAERISDPNNQANGGTLLINNGHVVLTWEEGGFAGGNTQYVQRLSDSLERFTAPKPFCTTSLDGNGAVLMACETQGHPVPDCFQPGGPGLPSPIYYRYIETYKRGMGDDQWTAPQIASDVHRRVRNTSAFADAEGNGFLVFASDVPCGTGDVQLLARILPTGQCSREHETLIDVFPLEEQQAYGFNYGASLDGQGTLHVIWSRTHSTGAFPAPFNSNIFTTALSAHRNWNDSRGSE